MSLIKPIKATCPSCKEKNVLVCSVCGKCGACSNHSLCKEPKSTRPMMRKIENRR